MSTDNPFSPGADPSAALASDLTPVPMDVQPILERCWELVMANPGVVLGALFLPLIPAMAMGVGGALLNVAAQTSHDKDFVAMATAGRFGLDVLSALIGLFFQLGTTRIFLNLAHGRYAEVGMLVGEGANYARGLGASLLVGLACLVGFLCLFVPGIIIATGLQFTIFALVDQDLGPIEAISESWRLTDGYKFTVWVINLVIAILALVITCMTLGVGYLVALPVLALTQAVMYHSLKHLQRRA